MPANIHGFLFYDLCVDIWFGTGYHHNGLSGRDSIAKTSSRGRVGCGVSPSFEHR